MLSSIWAGMILISVIYGIGNGTIGAVGNAAIASAREAVDLCITMIGIMSFWMGLMEVAKKSGLLEKIEKFLSPFVSWIFPKLPKNHPARSYITTNIVANILGLGWAATPAGLQAMEELAKHPINPGWDQTIATDEMCTFLVLNISSLQLIPVTIIAFRSQFGAGNPSSVVFPAMVATSVSTIVGVVYCKWKENKEAFD
ncbi:MAG: nucleoside recognition protein [Eubacterium sp.]|nr:nucleoside recognition protein [Eubacterium sp.]